MKTITFTMQSSQNLLPANRNVSVQLDNDTTRLQFVVPEMWQGLTKKIRFKEPNFEEFLDADNSYLLPQSVTSFPKVSILLLLFDSNGTQITHSTTSVIEFSSSFTVDNSTDPNNPPSVPIDDQLRAGAHAGPAEVDGNELVNYNLQGVEVSRVTLPSSTEGVGTEVDPVYTADKPFIALKTEIPSKVSELTNDKEFVTETQLNDALSGLNGGTINPVDIISPNEGNALEARDGKLFVAVKAAVLTGVLFVANTAITATDTILTAFGKLQAQITAMWAAIGDIITSPNIIDFVATKADLDLYDTTKVKRNDSIVVAEDETKEGGRAFYTWKTVDTVEQWVFKFSEAPKATKAELDALSDTVGTATTILGDARRGIVE